LFLLVGANHLLGEVQISARLSWHVALELAMEGVFDVAEEFLKFSVVNAVLLSSFHAPSDGCVLRLCG
jgi:hypothetical protein